MFEWRVTKDEQSLRDEHGAYLRDDWTSVSDISPDPTLEASQATEIATSRRH